MIDMEPVECDICGEQIERNQKALGLINGTIEECAEGFCADDGPWVIVAHDTCFWKRWESGTSGMTCDYKLLKQQLSCLEKATDKMPEPDKTMLVGLENLVSEILEQKPFAMHKEQ